MAPPAGRRGVRLDELVEVAVALGVRHRQVAGQDVVERRDVGRALDRRVPAQRHDPAARPAHVAEQQLDDRRGADVLDADRVLRPADRVAERARPLAAGVRRRAPRRRARKSLDAAAAGLGDELRRVAAVVLLQELEDAARVLERRVLLRRLAVLEPAAVAAVARLLAAASPSSRSPAAPCTSMPAYCQRRRVVLALLRVPAGEEAVEVLGVARSPRR